MNLGSIVFSISTRSFEELQRKCEYRWATMERLGRRPAKQWIGVGTDDITISGVVFPLLETGTSSVVGIGQIEEMRKLAEEGNPQDLVDGMGKILGRFVIESIDETASHHLDNGAPRQQEYSLSLSRYGEDGPDMSRTPMLAGGGSGNNDAAAMQRVNSQLPPGAQLA